MKQCEIIETCGFINKYKERNALACQGFIRMYCQGGKHSLCVRRRFLEQSGKYPCDDLLPNGKYLVSNVYD